MEQNTTSVVIEQQGENKKRGALAVILAVAFVAMLGIGTTFAYLTYQGNQTPNRFTTDVGISVDLLEPSWVAGDGVASDGKTGIPVEADNTQPTDAEAAKKDPYVVNTSRIGNEDQSGVSVYAGIKLTFQKWVATGVTNGADGSHTETGQYVNMTQDETAKLLNCYQFAATSKVGEGDGYAGDNAGMFIDDGWIQVKADGSGTTAYIEDGSMYFVYKTAIESNSKVKEITATTKVADITDSDLKKCVTTSLFDQVLMKGDKTTQGSLVEALRTGVDSVNSGKNVTSDPGWRVLVSSAAIDATGIDDITTETAGIKALNAKHMETTDNGANAQQPNSTANGSGFRDTLNTDGNGTPAIPEDEWGF